MSHLISEHKDAFEQIAGHFKEELSGLRTGRATIALIENLPVVCYGSSMQLKSLASLRATDARTLVIDPWDKGLIKDIEKAIMEARLGVNPTVDGVILRLSFPELTTEARKQVVRVLHEKEEETKIASRQLREKIRESIAAKEQAHEIGEDERFRMQGELDTLV